jgi:hypothetical protein
MSLPLLPLPELPVVVWPPELPAPVLDSCPPDELPPFPDAPLDPCSTASPTCRPAKTGSLVAPPPATATTETTNKPGVGETKVPSALTVAIEPGGATAIDHSSARPAGTVCASSVTRCPGAIGEAGGTRRTTRDAGTPQPTQLRTTKKNRLHRGHMAVTIPLCGGLGGDRYLSRKVMRPRVRS